MGNIKDTQYFQAVQDKKIEVSDVLEQVYIALTEKGMLWGTILFLSPLRREIR